MFPLLWICTPPFAHDRFQSLGTFSENTPWSSLWSLKSRIHPYFSRLPSAWDVEAAPASNGNRAHAWHSLYASLGCQAWIYGQVASVPCGSACAANFWVKRSWSKKAECDRTVWHCFGENCVWKQAFIWNDQRELSTISICAGSWDELSAFSPGRGYPYPPSTAVYYTNYSYVTSFLLSPSSLLNRCQRP